MAYLVDFDWTQTLISGLNEGVREKKVFKR